MKTNTKKAVMTKTQDITKMLYIIEDREAGNQIERASSLDAARQIVSDYEKDDKDEGIYVPNFYAVRFTDKHKNLL